MKMSRSPFFRDSRNFSRISRISFLWISSFKEYAVTSSISSSSLHNSNMCSVDRFPAKTVNCQVSGYFSKKSRQNCRFSGWYGTPCSQPCIIDAFIGVFLIIQNIPGNTEAVPAILFFGRLYGFF